MNALRFVTLLLAALGLAPGAAHVLELPVKLDYSPQFYAQVTSSLYALFGAIGGTAQVAALVSACVLCYLSRKRPESIHLLLGAVCLAVSMLLWATVVQPVNAEWASVLRSSPDAITQSYSRLSTRWEYGHVAAFLAWLTGYCSLQWAMCGFMTGAPERELHRQRRG